MDTLRHYQTLGRFGSTVRWQDLRVVLIELVRLNMGPHNSNARLLPIVQVIGWKKQYDPFLHLTAEIFENINDSFSLQD